MAIRRGCLRGLVIVSLSFGSGTLLAQGLSGEAQLGKSLFFDDSLSINGNQSCGSCHGPDAGFSGPLAALNEAGAVYEGSVAGLFGNRRPPSAAYATTSPVLHYVIEKPKNRNKAEALFAGGNFFDGRATGERLGSPAADQAQGPFLNPVEQALPDSACVVYRACNAAYPVSLSSVYPGSCDIAFPAETDAECAGGGMVPLSSEDRDRVAAAYDNIALAIATYESSSEVNAFSSKFDAYLAGEASLTRQEKRGLNLFRGKGKCANCHTLETDSDEAPPLLTDYSFSNLGLPRNPDNPWYEMPAAINPAGAGWVDMGLGAFLSTRMDYQAFAQANYGKHKVPTLRNADKRPHQGFVKAFGHNGYFKSLKQVVHFYNTRDAKPVCPDDPGTDVDESLFLRAEAAIAQGCWPRPEVEVNVDTRDMGNLRLTESQENAIVAFMKTLSDGYDGRNRRRMGG
ncbi:MAG: cytochrome c peroxidase [Halieaceae bacterium]|jgi:cytochrome c peroxidase|nr:cytochrome c peroxidase [Halieaceae bacterium]